MIRIVIVDNHAIVRSGLRQFFAEQGDLRVTGEAVNGREALALVREGDLDVLVMDLSMPEHGGIDALADIRARAPELPVLILSGYAEEHYATTLLKQGASGYLNKQCEPEEIVRAIRTLFRGRKYITAGVAERVAEGLGSHVDKLPHGQLSEREFQVFLRLAMGETSGHIALSIFLSVKTVSTYRTRVMEKRMLASNSNLTYYALKNGLLKQPRQTKAQCPEVAESASGFRLKFAQKANKASMSCDLSYTTSAPSAKHRARTAAVA